MFWLIAFYLFFQILGSSRHVDGAIYPHLKQQAKPDSWKSSVCLCKEYIASNRLKVIVIFNLNHISWIQLLFHTENLLMLVIVDLYLQRVTWTPSTNLSRKMMGSCICATAARKHLAEKHQVSCYICKLCSCNCNCVWIFHFQWFGTGFSKVKDSF